MTTYFGGVVLIISAVVSFQLGAPIWAAALVGLIGLITGHYFDPYTHWGPNRLSQERAKEES